MPEYRQNPLTGNWVIIAAERAERPNAIDSTDTPATPQADYERTCPFCPGNERQTPAELFAVRLDGSQPDAPGWTLRAFGNKYPAARLDADEVPTPDSIALGARTADTTTPHSRQDSPLTVARPAVGQHEVLVESPAHDGNLARYEPRQVELILEALRHRYRMLMQAREVRYVCLYKNHGRAAGASLEHPHFQLIATSVVPPSATTMLQRQEAFAKEHGRALFDAMLAEEIEIGRRVVSSNDAFALLCPWASVSAYEMWIVPREPLTWYGDMADEALPLLGMILQDGLTRLMQRLGDPPYNLVIHSGPKVVRAHEHVRMFIQIIPRQTGLAGFELGSGMFINQTPPEAAAEELRSVG
jgi:UDPglucose--hexose-1-phosphate uridylyltransferase